MGNANNTYRRDTISKGTAAFLTIIGWVCAILSLFFYPFIFGLVGVITGVLTTKSGSRPGLALIVTSIILMSIGLIYSDIILNYARHFLGF
jgi:hypothetical protein